MGKNIVFDVGGVLLPFDPVRFCAEITDDPLAQRELRQKVFQSVTWAQMDRGLYTIEEGAEIIKKTLPEKLKPLCERLVTGWFEGREGSAEMEALLRRRKAEGFGLYILSNAPSSYYRFRTQLPALDCFDGELPSCDCGLLKPDPAIYRSFFLRFGLHAEDCFFVDDSPLNVEGALFAGMGGGFVFHGDVAPLEAAIRKWA